MTFDAKVRSFCSRAESLTGRRLYGPFAWDHFNAPAQLFLFHDFRDRLGPADIERLSSLCGRTFTSNSGITQDERTVSLVIDSPFEVENMTANAIRWKGIHPVIERPGIVERYDSGKGFVTREIAVTAPYELSAKEQYGVNDYDARGAMAEDFLWREIAVPFSLPARTTDTLLGFGIFDDLLLDGTDMLTGFAMFGMERLIDLRVLQYFINQAKATGQLPMDAKDIARMTGSVLGDVNGAGIFHEYAHPNNFSYDAASGTRATDFETSVPLNTIPREMWPLVLYREVFESLNPFYRMSNFPSWKARAPEVHIETASLVPHLLWGYFKGDRTIEFVREIEPFVTQDRTNEEITAKFGYVPKYKRGFREDKNSFSLVEPGIRLLTVPSEGLPAKLDMREFLKEARQRLPLFELYYEALKIKADQIGG